MPYFSLSLSIDLKETRSCGPCPGAFLYQLRVVGAVGAVVVVSMVKLEVSSRGHCRVAFSPSLTWMVDEGSTAAWFCKPLREQHQSV